MILPCAAGGNDAEHDRRHTCARRNRRPMSVSILVAVAACTLAQLTTARPLAEQNQQVALGGQTNGHNERLLASLDESFSKFVQAGEKQQPSERLAEDGHVTTTTTTTTTRASNNNNNNGEQQQQQIVALRKISCDKLSLVVMAQRAFNSSTSSGALRKLAECRDENLLDVELVEMFENSTIQLQASAPSDSNQTRIGGNKQRDRTATVRQAHECGQNRSVGCNSSASRLENGAQQPEVATDRAFHLGAKMAITLVIAGGALVALATFVDSQSSSDDACNMNSLGDGHNEAGSLRRRCQDGGGGAKQREANARGRFFLDLGPQVPKLRDYRSLSISSNCSSNLFCSTNSVASSSAPILATSNQLNSFAGHAHHHYQSCNGAQQQQVAPVYATAGQYESNLELHLSQSCDQHQPTGSNQPAASNYEQSSSLKQNPKGELQTDSLARQILLAFSLRQTASQIFGQQPPAGAQNSAQSPESVDWLHGLRFFSMIWVIVIHSYNFALRWMFFSNTSTLDGIYKSAASQFIANGSFACDSFFFVGGFLLPYLALKPTRTERNNGNDEDDDDTRHALGRRQQRKQHQQVAVSLGEHQDEAEQLGEESNGTQTVHSTSSGASALAATCRTSGCSSCCWSCCCGRACANLTGSCRQRSTSACKQAQQQQACALAQLSGATTTCCRSPSAYTCLCQSCRPTQAGLDARLEEGPLSRDHASQAQAGAQNQSNAEQNNNSQCKRRLAPNTNELANLAAVHLKPPGKLTVAPMLANNHQAKHNFTATEDLSAVESNSTTNSSTSSRTPTTKVNSSTLNKQQPSKQAFRMKTSSKKANDSRDQFAWQQCLANVLRRYVRMMPLMMAIIGLCTSLLRYFGDGPVWRESTMMYDEWCRRNWWVNAMFLHNFVNRENMCLSHSWYSAVDFQLFLVGQLVLFALCRNRRFGLALLLGLLLASPLVTMVLTIRHHLPAVPLISSVNEQTMNLYYGQVYIKPYSRASPYLIGMLLAYLMRTTSLSQWRLKRWQIVAGWTLAICLLLAIILAMQPAMNGRTPGELESALYSGWSRPLWACAAGWIIFACITNQAGFIGRLLGARCFVPLSRLTYPAFLVHPIIMASFYGTRQASFEFSHYLMLYLILGNIVITYASAFVLAVLVELPFLSIERVISRRLFGKSSSSSSNR